MREDYDVCIVGNNASFNELLSAAIRAQLGFSSFVCSNVPRSAGIVEVWEMSPTILLVDDMDAELRTQLTALLAQGDIELSSVAAALFNVGRVTPELCSAVRHGITGVFLRSDPISRLLAGLRAIAGGQTWVPREVHTAAVADPGVQTLNAVVRAGLTMREVQILSHLASGSTNEQMAASLFLSPHTIKTHLYNIFRKIRVTSRLRATLWAAENLRTWPDLKQLSAPSAPVGESLTPA